MSDTPRTDAAAIRCACSTYVVPSEFARELERENAALRADKDRLDWLESRLNSSYVELCHYGNGSQLDGDAARAYDRTKPYYVDGQFGRSGASLRDAIDAARKEEQP